MPRLLLLLLPLLLSLFPHPISSNPFPITPHFDPNLNIAGDAKLATSGSFVRLTDPSKSSRSSGLLFQRAPFKFLGPKPRSFSTDFTFSVPPRSSDGIALIIVPKDFPSRLSAESFGLSRENRFFGVEFDAMVNENVGDENDNHVGIDVGSLVSLKICNVSSIKLKLSSGVKLHSWVDYDSSSKRLEVRLCKFGGARPFEPLLAYQVDLGEMWKGEEVLMGLSSSSGNSVEATTVYSWSVRARRVPSWLHSQPLDPFKEFKVSNEHTREHKMVISNGPCLVALLSGLIFAVGFGALVAFAALFFRAIFASEKEAEVQPKCLVYPGEFRYEKVNVVVDDITVNAKN
nr:L-type lectin-domain containing receptor kinase S.4-like [Ipomoea batatas]